MILTKEVELKPTGKSIGYYRSLGYDAKCRMPLLIKIEDLPEHSDAIIEVLCDYCNKNIVSMKYSSYTKGAKNVEKHACESCRYEKIKEVTKKLYGVECIGSLPETKEKRDKTILKRYNIDCYSKTEESREKARKTFLDKYGVDNPSKSQAVSEKRKSTNLQKYGVAYTLQSPEVREKISKTLYRNGTQKTSKQQRYLHGLYGGEMNYSIKYYDVDIYLPEDNLTIEYDGGFHLGNVITGRETMEEHNRKQIIRDKTIKREGYKQMRIISTNDLLPSDQTLLQMLQQVRQYFLDYPNHSWIEFNIDTSTVRNAEHKEGVFFDFGKLRKIKKVT